VFVSSRLSSGGCSAGLLCCCSRLTAGAPCCPTCTPLTPICWMSSVNTPGSLSIVVHVSPLPDIAAGGVGQRQASEAGVFEVRTAAACMQVLSGLLKSKGTAAAPAAWCRVQAGAVGAGGRAAVCVRVCVRA
jgi:hypothetical protein